MELTKEFIEKNAFNEEQVAAITGHYDNEVIPSIKKEYDGKANENAEGILTGAAKFAAEKLGVSIERNQGEKFGDYLQRISTVGLEAKQKELDDKDAELKEKLKNFDGSPDVKAALEIEQKKNDTLLKELADLEPLKGFDVKYEQSQKELGGLKLNVAFNMIKPNFPDTVNSYEAKARWEEFQKNVLEKHNIEIVDNEPMAIDKKNIHKQTKLSALLEADVNIKELLKGRQQRGTNASSSELADIEGVPFKVPKNASSIEQSSLVREFLVEKLGDALHPDFSKEFQEILTKIKLSA